MTNYSRVWIRPPVNGSVVSCEWICHCGSSGERIRWIRVLQMIPLCPNHPIQYSDTLYPSPSVHMDPLRGLLYVDPPQILLLLYCILYWIWNRGFPVPPLGPYIYKRPDLIYMDLLCPGPPCNVHQEVDFLHYNLYCSQFQPDT